jgi:FkbM family methyltransferase
MDERATITVNYNNQEFKFLIPLDKGSHINKDPSLYIADFNKDTKFLSNFLKEGDIALDIGARDGDSTLPLRAVIGNTGKILAFEPNPFEFPNLIENIKLNNILNIEAYNFGISKENEYKEFLFEENFYNGGISTEQIKIGYFPKKIKLQCKNLENLSKEIKADLDKVKFIKTDTEGYDVDILEELGPIINKTRPFILMEWWPTTEARMVEYFIKNNYVPFNKDNLSLIQNLHISNRVHDIFLIPRELLKPTE